MIIIFISEQKQISRETAKRWIEQENVTINNKKVKPSYKTQENDIINIEPEEIKDIELKAQNIPLEVLYQDNDILVVNKPKGMVVHPANGNPDIVGWVYAKGTGIDYPIVQGKDNEEYLHMDNNKKKSSSGTIFLDHGCDKSFISDNNIIYGHHMKNGTMFAKLLKFREESFLKKHHVIILYTPKKTIYLKVISAYAVKAQDQMPITFANETQKKEYITKIRRMSEPSIKLDDKKIDRIYTFVTVPL